MLVRQLVEQNAQNFPDRLAVCLGEGRYTYAELNNWANHLANYLQTQQVSKDDRVIVALPRSPVQVAMLLAIWKLGAVYVPLNPGDSHERLSAIQESTSAKCVIQASNLPDRKLDSAATNPDIETSDDDLAYIIYTSGTTSQPKGVPIAHKGLVYWARHMPSILDLNKDNDSIKVLNYCLPSFDASIWEYMIAWLAAAPLYMVTDETRYDTTLLSQFIQESGITHATLMPHVLTSMIDDLPTSLRVVCSTGEACTKPIVEALEANNTTVINGYGTTELCFGATAAEITSSMFDEYGRAPVGHPPGSEVELRLSDNNELLIHSPYMTTGYWKNPEATEKHFVTVGGKVYHKTGDTFIKDKGGFYYGGRIGLEAVKVRGASIDLLPIEDFIYRASGGCRACIITHGEVGHEVLIAYIQQSNASIDIEALEAKLFQETSFNVRIAKFIISDEALPLTANGKLDRNALKQKYQDLRASPDRLKPFLPIEHKLVEIFSDVLQVNSNDISCDDTFLTLGGSSLTLSQLQNKIKDIFGVDIPSNDFFACDLTINRLIDAIHQRRWIHEPNRNCLLMAGQGDGVPVFMIHPITGESQSTYKDFAAQWIKKDPELAIYGINARGYADSKDISTNIDLIAEDYVGSILAKQPDGKYCLFGWSGGGAFASRVAELLLQKGKSVKLALLDSISPVIYQQCTQSLFIRLLTELFERVKQHDEQQELKNDGSREAQIKQMFARHLLTAALLLACQRYQFEQLKEDCTTFVFSCEETREKIKNMSEDYLLGWKGESISSAHIKKATGHFDFIRDGELIKQVLRYFDVEHNHSEAKSTNAFMRTVIARLEQLTSEVEDLKVQQKINTSKSSPGSSKDHSPPRPASPEEKSASRVTLCGDSEEVKKLVSDIGMMAKGSKSGKTLEYKCKKP